MVNQIRGYITQYRAMAQGIGDAAEGLSLSGDFLCKCMSLTCCILGAADAGDLAQVAEVVGDAADVAEDGAEAGAAAAEETASLVGIAAKGLVVVGILATIGTIIFDGVEGAKQRDTCRQ